MKKLLLLISCFFLIGEFFCSDLLGQDIPDPIIDYNGIPIITYLKEESPYSDNNLYKDLDAAGIFAAQVLNMKPEYLTTSFANTNFKILPEQHIDNNNYIVKYSEAKYSVWEAEGVTNPNDGAATLYYNNLIGKKTLDGSAIMTMPGDQIEPANSEGPAMLIYGPYYKQEAKYAFIDKDQWIDYIAEFSLKKEDYGSTPPLPNDIVCQLQIRTSRVYLVGNVWYIDSTNVVPPIDIPYRVLTNYYKTFPVPYKFDMVPLYVTTKGRAIANYVQFKVLWKGDPFKMSLYVDNITLTDPRGWRIKELPNLVKDEIDAQIALDFDGKAIGWMGVDEPNCIDQFKPIRFVQDRLNYWGKSVWFSLGNRWNGKWGDDLLYPYGTYGLSEFDEFYKQVKKANFWSSRYLFQEGDGYENYGIDARDGKIKIQVNEIYSHFKGKDNVFWGACVNSGRYRDSPTEIDLYEVRSKELLYSVNLGLLCGAKVIAFWPYFANIDNPLDPSRTALVNFSGTTPDYTDKWHTIKDTIAPRLSGPMGITLKKLTPKSRFLTVHIVPHPNINSTYEFISDISAVNQSINDPCIFDLGFFEDKSNPSHKYFMPLNRYYSSKVNHIFSFGISDLDGYNNWKLTDYVDNTYMTLVQSNGAASFTDSFYPGDAELYSLKPVIQYGGDIIESETVPTNTTLKENVLNIKSGATLTVAGTYNIYKDIIVEDGASINLSANAHLKFYDNARLIVNGTIISPISGTRPVLDFNNASYSGITVNSRTNLQNLQIKNASVGITLMVPESEGVPQTIQIKNNVFDNCELGISAVNTPMLLIAGNDFISHGGIFLSNVNEFNIVYNNFTCNESNPISKLPGIELYSSSGKIRNNEISEFAEGVKLGSSFVSFGNNTIMNNFSAGLYVGTGSEADLRREVRRVPCVPGLIYYPIRGYNTIENNNNSNFLYDGAEIVLNEGIIFLNQGNNRIADDRAMSFPTFTLMDGTPEDDIPAEYNDWGEEEPIDRFGNLSVLYTPWGMIEPDFSIDCPKIILMSDNTIIDTVQGINTVDGELSEIDLLYESANSLYIAGEYEMATEAYENIISQFYDSQDAILAYDQLLQILVVTNAEQEQFDNLRDYYRDYIQMITDPFVLTYVTHLSDMCYVNGERVENAIASFESIITNNPNTEEALFAQVDLYTAALLDTAIGLSKGFGKVTLSTYHNKISKLFNRTGKTTVTTVIPTEYMLFQNYPNPFNPSTNIRYAIKDKSEVKLIVYDILGRVVKELVNELKEPGYYDVQFNMSNFASGVYFYSLQTRHYVKTNKMLLIK